MDYNTDFKDSHFHSSYGSVWYKHHYGDGATVIFLHGLAANTRSFFRLAKAMPNDMDAYLIDMLGHGKSDVPSLSYTVRMQTEIIRELVLGKGLKDAFLFGHSYGGWVALTYASLGYPCRGIVLEDSVGLVDLYSDLVKSKTFGRYKEEVFHEAKRLDANMPVIESILDHDFGTESLDARAIGKIRVPTLILWGEKDDHLELRYGKLFNSYIGGSKLKVIEDADHTPHYSKPNETMREVLDFISRN